MEDNNITVLMLIYVALMVVVAVAGYIQLKRRQK